MLVVGGYGTDKEPIALTEIYDPQTDTWTSAVRCSIPGPTTRRHLVGDELVLIAGGLGEFTLAEKVRCRDRNVVGGGAI